jgi:hypothetical protein
MYALPDIIAVGGISPAGASRVEIESGIFLLKKRRVSDGMDGEYPYALLGTWADAVKLKAYTQMCNS